tara:strand:+ start:495 stop:740 length:246 start_codon:yes stop_codon:yes gene_type:complete
MEAVEWFSWSNLFYLIGLILAGYASAITAKNRNIFVQIQELVDVLEKANRDKKITAAEKKQIVKEGLDIGKAVIQSKWKLW